MSKEFINRIFSSLILIPVSFYFIIKGSIFFNFFILISFFITIYEWHMMSKKKIYYLPGLFFLLISFISIYVLRNNNSDEALYSFLFVLNICIFTDIGGYIFGNLFKGPKLTKISPKKTYSGMFGSYFFSVILTIIYVENSHLLNLGFKIKSLDVNIFILIFLISTVSQMGDIIISFYKRTSKIKDTGKIIPGHGGLLDRIDGMIFAFPFFYGVSFFF